MGIVGTALTRVDGRAKVTGQAKYAAEFAIPNVAYAVLMQSTIPSGRITGIDTAQAERAPQVIAILTPDNAPKLPGAEKRVSVLQDNYVYYNGQPVGLVVADTLHSAQYAASLVQFEYQTTPPTLDFMAGFPNSYPGSHNNEPGDMAWGDVDQGLKEAEVLIDQLYTTPIEHHSPMEPHATIAQWEGNRLNVFDATQNIFGVRKYLAKWFGISEENVHVTALFVGGGFGCKGQVWSHVVLAALAARQVNRPVKLVLDRPQMFGPVGARPRTHQRLTLGATRDGKLMAIRHDVHTNTSFLEDYLESSAFPTRVMYACANISTTHRLVPLNLGTPTYMRAPGVATGTYALEVAMDELAYAIKKDPLELRLLNYTDVDPHSKKPFTEKSLRECYTQGAVRFGWSRRTFEPRSMRNGSKLIGWGMATETYPANRNVAEVSVRLLPSGRAVVASGTEDIGTGMYSIMTQVAADALGISPDFVDAKLGDTNFPQAPLAAGSMSTASVMPAVQAAALNARKQIIDLAAGDPKSPFYGVTADDVFLADGRLVDKRQNLSESFAELMARHRNKQIESIVQASPRSDADEYSRHSFGAIFAEVLADPELGTLHVSRVVAVYDVGKVLNTKTGRSQFIGGIVWGISLALHEQTHIDERNGRVVNATLAGYHVPVNADIGDIDVSALDIPDTNFNPLGARGIGEIGITGTGAAIANAVFHATGKRVRDLPITPDKLLV